jgi:regulator of protease activity HflC (stomatin/prohibitin superfamily)
VYTEKIVRPAMRSSIREVLAGYEAKDMYSEKRGEVTRSIHERLTYILGKRGIEIEDVLLRNITLPEDVLESIQKKLQAEQEAERYNFLLEAEQKEAERKQIEAEGQREAQRIISQTLTTRYLQYLYIESLKEREGTIYVPTNSNNGMPLFRGI